jgi:hypothetical protein
MRASNLSLVIATGYCLLWTVRAQKGNPTGGSGLPQGPNNITVEPPTLTADGPFVVGWQDNASDCFIGGVYLVEIGGGIVQTILRKLPGVQRPISKQSR